MRHRRLLSPPGWAGRRHEHGEGSPCARTSPAGVPGPRRTARDPSGGRARRTRPPRGHRHGGNRPLRPVFAPCGRRARGAVHPGRAEPATRPDLVRHAHGYTRGSAVDGRSPGRRPAGCGTGAGRNGQERMSGHSKWATTKYRKGAQDKARAKVFAKCIRAIEVAARDGGGDLDANAGLRTAFQKARAASVPIDTIEKAIKRGTGRPRGGALRVHQLRGLRARRRGHHGRDPERQPQPHRRRDAQSLLPQRRQHG